MRRENGDVWRGTAAAGPVICPICSNCLPACSFFMRSKSFGSWVREAKAIGKSKGGLVMRGGWSNPIVEGFGAREARPGLRGVQDLPSWQ